MTFSTRIRWLTLVLLLQGALAAALFSVHILQQVRLNAPQPFVRRPREEAAMIVKKIEFRDASSIKEWEEKTFNGKTHFEVLSDGGKSFLATASKDASSGLYTKMTLAFQENLSLTWKWKVQKFPKKKEPAKLSNRREDDFGARVYVIFPGSNFFNTDVIEYIWDESIAVDTVAPSPYSERVQLFVIRSGAAPETDNGWYSEQRKPFEDYEKLFRKKPTRAIGAVALMSDSDNTRTESEAFFGDFIFKIKKNMTKSAKEE